MCGIAGFVGRSLMTPDQDKISQAKASLFLRGPDGSGTYQKKNRKQNHSFYSYEIWEFGYSKVRNL